MRFVGDSALKCFFKRAHARMNKEREKQLVAINIDEIIYAGVGFLLVALLVPMVMQMVVSTSIVSWNPAVVTIWQVLLPILYMIGTGIYFILKLGKEDQVNA